MKKLIALKSGVSALHEHFQLLCTKGSMHKACSDVTLIHGGDWAFNITHVFTMEFLLLLTRKQIGFSLCRVVLLAPGHDNDVVPCE